MNIPASVKHSVEQLTVGLLQHLDIVEYPVTRCTHVLVVV